jgi:outer membrane protein
MHLKTTVTVLLVLAALGRSARGEVSRIAFVDLDKTFSEYYKTKVADAQLKEQAEGFKGERKSLVEAFQKLQEQFDALREEAQNKALNDDVRSEKRNAAEEKLVEIREQESKIRRFDESRQKQLDEQSRRMRNRLVDEIKEVVKNYASAQKLLAVVDASGNSLNGVSLVVYTDPQNDITQTIIDLLNKGKTMDEGAAAPAAAPTPALKAVPAVKPGP